MLWLVETDSSVMEAKMADPSGEGWPSFLGETMSDLRTNFNSDKGMNEPMIDGFDGKSFIVIISARNLRKK